MYLVTPVVWSVDFANTTVFGGVSGAAVTVMVRAAVEALAPAASYALAVMLYVPAATFVQLNE
jgi:hypothetical protein